MRFVDSVILGVCVALLGYAVTPWLVGLLWLADIALRWAFERPIHLFWIMTPFTILILGTEAWQLLRGRREEKGVAYAE